MKISPHEFDLLLQQKEVRKKQIILVDIRSKNEFLMRNIGGNNIPAELFNYKETLKQLASFKEATIVLTCQYDPSKRVEFVADVMEDAGFDDVRELKGGINAWIMFFRKQRVPIADLS